MLQISMVNFTSQDGWLHRCMIRFGWKNRDAQTKSWYSQHIMKSKKLTVKKWKLTALNHYLNQNEFYRLHYWASMLPYAISDFDSAFLPNQQLEFFWEAFESSYDMMFFTFFIPEITPFSFCCYPLPVVVFLISVLAPFYVS